MSRGPRGRVIHLPQRQPVPARPRQRPPTGVGTSDWAAWLCLGLGILCGAGAIYIVLFVS